MTVMLSDSDVVRLTRTDHVRCLHGAAPGDRVAVCGFGCPTPSAPLCVECGERRPCADWQAAEELAYELAQAEGAS